MNKIKKHAVAVLAVVALSGCTSLQVADLARVDGTPANVEETRVSQPLSTYGHLGGYRYRRFAAVAKAT